VILAAILGLAIDLGSTRAEVERALVESAAWLEASEPQAMRRGLIETGLLGALGKAGAIPKTSDGLFDGAAFKSFASGTREGRTFAIALGPDARVRAILVRVKVPVERGAIERVLAELGELEAVSRDRYGNAFEWVRRTKGGEIRAWYVPERDELIVLVAR
jgi:hypothetical protein